MAAHAPRCPVATSNVIVRKVSRAERAPTMWRSADWIHANTVALVATHSAPISKLSTSFAWFSLIVFASFRLQIKCRAFRTRWRHVRTFPFSLNRHTGGHGRRTDGRTDSRELRCAPCVYIECQRFGCWTFCHILCGGRCRLVNATRNFEKKATQTRTLTTEWKLTRILCSENQNRN